MDFKALSSILFSAALACAAAYAAGPGGNTGGGPGGGPGGDSGGQGGGGQPGGGGSFTYDSFISVTTNANCLVREGILFGGTSSLAASVAPTLSTITELADGVFAGNTAITAVDLSNTSITEVSDGAFSGCTALASVKLPSTCTTIGANAFAGCESLSSLTASGVTVVGADAFRGCLKLSAVPSSATSLGAYSFSQCGVTSVSVEDVSLGEGAFAGCESLVSAATGATLPDAVFSGCTALATADWSGVSSIGRAALVGIPATTLSLANGVSLGEYALAADTATLATVLTGDSVPDSGETTFLGREMSYTPVPGSVARIEVQDLVDWLVSDGEGAGVALPADYNTATLETWLSDSSNATAYAYATELAENSAFVPLTVSGDTFVYSAPSSQSLCIDVTLAGCLSLSEDESDWTPDALETTETDGVYVAAEATDKCFARLVFSFKW